MPDPSWSPNHIGKGSSWPSQRALAVAQHIAARRSVKVTLHRTSLTGSAAKRAPDKKAIASFFKKQKVPLDYEEFLGKRAEFGFESGTGAPYFR